MYNPWGLRVTPNGEWSLQTQIHTLKSKWVNLLFICKPSAMSSAPELYIILLLYGFQCFQFQEIVKKQIHTFKFKWSSDRLVFSVIPSLEAPFSPIILFFVISLTTWPPHKDKWMLFLTDKFKKVKVQLPINATASCLTSLSTSKLFCKFTIHSRVG